MSERNPRKHQTVSQLLRELIESWSFWEVLEKYYLTVLAPTLVDIPDSCSAQEKRILIELRAQLSEREWIDLPQLIAKERREVVRELENEAMKREAQAKKLQEAELKRIQQELVRQETKERKKALLTKIDIELHRDFLGAEKFFQAHSLGIVTDDEFRIRKIDFVRKWFVERIEKSKRNGLLVPDNEQLEAIASVNGHVQVVARAGSGKTATLVSRALFLLEHCQVDPSSLLLLAFNRKAAIEMRRRLLALLHDHAEGQVTTEVCERRSRVWKKGPRIDQSELVSDSVDAVGTRLQVRLPHVMTFHALAYALVHPEERLLYNGAEAESQGLSRVFQSVIDDHIQSPTYLEKIRVLMVAHFREDWDNIVAGNYDMSRDELLQFKRSLPRESLGGEHVKSYGEKLIADFLFEHNIPYKYERSYLWSGMNYRPDFTIFKTATSGIIVEYFGLAGEPDYDTMSEQKRCYWKAKPDWDLIELAPSDMTQGTTAFQKLLKVHLEQHEITCHRLSEDEIWHRVRDRAIDRFTKAMVNFVTRCRKLSLTPGQLQSRVDAHEPLSLVESMFISMAQKLYSAYLDRLSATGEEDFDGLMQRATEVISKGVTRFRRKSGAGDLVDLKYILIDEFQDFSDLFYRLLSSIRTINSEVKLFCVGDDWQAINGFAGSDLRFFENFDEYIGESMHFNMPTNYRSARAIVAVGNAVMNGLGKPAAAHKLTAGKVIVVDASTFKPSLIEQERHQGDIITPVVTRIVSKALAAGTEVVLLSRSNYLPWALNLTCPASTKGTDLEKFRELVRSFFPKGVSGHITVSTAHSYKGLEKPTVVVLDAVARSYPLIHPNWIFLRIFGHNPMKITQEERRLFYVALTRAIDKLVIITDGQNQTPFLSELEKCKTLTKINWDDYPAVREGSSKLIVKVGNQNTLMYGATLAIKDQLKACGYRWQSTGWPAWVKTCLADGFDLAAIKAEVWSEEANGVEVRIHNEAEAVIGKFRVDSGKWVVIKDNLHLIMTASVDHRA